MKAKLAVLLVVALVAAVFAVPGTASAGKGKKKSGPQVVGTDPDGDWGEDLGPEFAPVGDALGQDLVEATIEMVDMENLEFVLKLNSLPPIGGTPEITRYTWNFELDGEHRELDGKFTNYSRGICDPTSGQCPPPRDPGTTPFFLRGECGVHETPAINFTACQELAVIEAAFDPAEATITIPVSLEVLGAKPGSKITPAANIFGGSVSAAPAVFLTSSAMPMDTMVLDKTFVVASGKKAKKGKGKKK